MYAAVRLYRVSPGSTDEMVHRVKEEFVPVIKQVPGFIAYYGVQVGKGELITISMFEDRAGAEESTRQAASWVPENVAMFVLGPAEVREGQVVLHEVV